MTNTHHIITTKTLTQPIITQLLEQANVFLNTAIQQPAVLPSHTGKLITTLFFEPSTRTLNSFLIAAKRLNALTISPNLSHSALCKGESLEDTIHTLETMGTNCFIIRHSDDNLINHVSNIVNKDTSIINAGSGITEHPSQALLDLMTIQQHYPALNAIKIAIIGDIKHSRVVSSLLPLLTTMGMCNISCIGPQAWLPTTTNHDSITCSSDIEAGLKDADVIMTLRIQKERLSKAEQLDENLYRHQFCLTPDRLNLASPQAIVMHPGPMNQHTEIHPAVSTSQQSVILSQVKNGVAMRMALINYCLNATIQH